MIIQDDSLKLDSTGEFLKMGRRGEVTVSEKPERAEWEILFFKEAFFLYENKDRILSDSRMFLTPLPFRNGLAYTGTSGLGNATLGIYIEWWDTCERAVIRFEDEIRALTYHIAGSPLSGSNRCSAVTRGGKSLIIQFPSPFYEIWNSFMTINQRYSEAKRFCQAYTLEETVAKLRETV